MKKKVPEIRFRGFDDEWEEYKIGNIFDRIKNPVDVKKDEEYKQIGIRSHGKGIFYKEPVTGEQLGNKRVFWIEPNVFIVNIVFAWERAVARTTEKEVGMIASHRFPMYKPKKDILDLDFITELFITKRGQALLELASPGGAGRNKTLGQKEFDDLVVKLPSIQEQKRISGFLDKIDRLIEKQDEKVKNYELYKKGMMQKIFSQEIRFRGDRGEEYPEWEKRRLKDIIKCIVDNRGKTPPTQKEGYPLLEINSIGDYHVNYNKVEKYVDKHTYLNWFRSYLMRGDILFSTVGNTAICSLYEEELKSVIAQNLIGIRFNENIDNKFMLYTLTETKNNRKIKSIQMNGVQPSIKVTQLIQLMFNIPKHKEEQTKIATFLSKIDDLIEKEKEKLENFKRWKKGLLQGMFV